MMNIYSDELLTSRNLAGIDNNVYDVRDNNFMSVALEEIKIKVLEDLKDLENINWEESKKNEVKQQ